jgi:hypothetical protein
MAMTGIKTFFSKIEYGHDGCQKNPLLIQIPKKTTYLSDKMHPKQDILKQSWPSHYRGPIAFSEHFGL